MPDVTAYVDDRQTSEFYPTPEKLVQRMLGKIKWDPVEAILEPSAGKGDILIGGQPQGHGQRHQSRQSDSDRQNNPGNGQRFAHRDHKPGTDKMKGGHDDDQIQ